MNPLLKFLLFALIVCICFVGVQYGLSYGFDLWQRPWAYSTHADKPLLIGTWQGTYRDPAGIAKTLKIIIDKPLTEANRLNDTGRRRRVTASRTAFEGTATANSSLGIETYELAGGVNERSGHQFHFELGPENGTYPILPNFYAAFVRQATWDGADALDLSLEFTYHRANGASYWDSTDPRFSRKIPIHMTRLHTN